MSIHKLETLKTGEPESPRIEATGPRRVFHAVLVIGGWALFIYWWWVVLQRVSAMEIRFSAAFVSMAAFTVVGVTLLWVAHNLSIFRRKGPRQMIPQPPPVTLTDKLGRMVVFKSGQESARRAPVIKIVVNQTTKYYEPEMDGDR